jgi:3D (Asp-Asp-Asp) domain-containing protein
VRTGKSLRSRGLFCSKLIRSACQSRQLLNFPPNSFERGNWNERRAGALSKAAPPPALAGNFAKAFHNQPRVAWKYMRRWQIVKGMFVGIAIAFLMLGRFDSGVQNDSAIGWASYYKSGKKTANGERFNPDGLTAAHRNLPFGTKVLVTNLYNGKSVVVRINDRGPFIKGRVIDLSLGAAKIVGLNKSGVAKISYSVIN